MGGGKAKEEAMMVPLSLEQLMKETDVLLNSAQETLALDRIHSCITFDSMKLFTYIHELNYCLCFFYMYFTHYTILFNSRFHFSYTVLLTITYSNNHLHIIIIIST